MNFPAVYEMISNIKARLDAGRALLYQTARYVDIYKGLEDIERTRKLTDEEKAELKLYQKLASACMPLACEPQSHRRKACGGGESEA